jgi:RNA polymerase sigma-70 factor (ECF subfamily)
MKASPATFLRHLSGLGTLPNTVSDHALLEGFVRLRDERAFAALVARHGPMVLRVCRRVLGNADDAEDALQAVFLVLARKAGSIRERDSLAAWLHGVAHRLALKARATITRRRRLELQPGASSPGTVSDDPLSNVTARELLTILEMELTRLPAKYRAPLLMCCLEGRTLQEAAQALGWSVGSVKGRLERGRCKLHARLVRRGVSLGVALAAANFAAEPSAAVPIALAKAVVKNGLLFASHKEAVGLSTMAIMLAQGALKEMWMSKLKVVTGLLLTVCVAALAVSTWARQARAQGQSQLPSVGDRLNARVQNPGQSPAVPVHFAPTPDEKPPVKPIVALHGEHSKIVKEKLLRITTADDWAALWIEHNYGAEFLEKADRSAEQSVELSFDKVMAIAVFEGTGRQNYGFVVDSIIENDEKILVRIKKLSYSVVGDPPPCEAWGVFVVPKSDKEVIVELDARTTRTGPAKWKEWKKFPAITDKP